MSKKTIKLIRSADVKESVAEASMDEDRYDNERRLILKDGSDMITSVHEADGDRKFARPVRLGIMLGVPVGLWTIIYLAARRLF
jgi:hypothetical protein